MKALKATWTDFLEKAGDKLAPTFEKLFGIILNIWPQVEPALLSFVELLANGFSDAAPVIGEFAENLLPDLLGLAGDLAPIFSEIGGELLPLFSDVLGTIIEAAGPLLPLVQTLISTLLPPLADLFGTLVDKLLPPLTQLLGALSPVIEALSPILDIVASAIGLVADAIAGLIGWLGKGIEKVGEFAQGLKDSAIGKFVSGIGEGISNAAGSVRSFFAGNAKGTDNFDGGWTRVHEAGDELIQAKHSGGIAYLPRGSAVVPASKTAELISGNRTPDQVVYQVHNQVMFDQEQDGLREPAFHTPAPQQRESAGNVIYLPPVDQQKERPFSEQQIFAGQQPLPRQNILIPFPSFSTGMPELDKKQNLGTDVIPDRSERWTPQIIRHNPRLDESADPVVTDPPKKPPPDEPPPDHSDDGGNPQAPPSYPPPKPPANPVPGRHDVIELRITVSSPDRSVSPEMLEQIIDELKPVVDELIEQRQDENFSDLAIQNGYVAG